MKECNYARTERELDRDDPMRNVESAADMEGLLSVKGTGVNRGKSLTHLKPSQDARNTMLANRDSALSQHL